VYVSLYIVKRSVPRVHYALVAITIYDRAYNDTIRYGLFNVRQLILNMYHETKKNTNIRKITKNKNRYSPEDNDRCDNYCRVTKYDVLL